MEVQDVIRGVQPLIGDLIPIKTVQETQPTEEYGEAYVAEVNVKSAAKVVKVLDANIPRDPVRPMNHLRRFAKQSNLPEPLHPLLLGDNPSPQSIFVLIPPPLPEVELLQELLAPFVVPSPQTETEADTPSDTQSQSTSKVKLCTVKVPTLPPLGAAQADRWTNDLWPVVYNPAAARATVAPPVQVLNRTREFIQPDAGWYLSFARKVAEEAVQSGRGRSVGAVVVDPDIVSRLLDAGEDMDFRWPDAIVAVAGDARYSRREAGQPSAAELYTGVGPNPATETYNADLEGGPDLHALMRAAEIIAQKRRAGEWEAENDELPSLSPLEAHFISQLDATAPKAHSESKDTTPSPEKYQKTGVEESHAIHISAASKQETTPGFRIRPRTQGGYLCTDLDVYLTHEPCVCCCMGLLLSRFRSVIFPQTGRMVTGGLASEPVVTPVPIPESEMTEQHNAEHSEHSQGHMLIQDDDESKRTRQYYGLHWRKELNWRALGFEFIQENGDHENLAADGVAFYA
ncbi:putative tRNA-specific adenosine-34 deaminase subunit Tad3 [Aspergillus lucknowensis]|uniref:tRNA-specific adenosine-34 deaminase subunit Tad3 n=1 Tax=Aspergillus lucknowensis TaxID=176173 RepID=A0ABR4LG87_9EURO